jgi:hypothetical protein
MGDFNGSNYDDKFIGDLVSFVAGESFHSKFERFFLTHALKFSADEEHKLEYYEIYTDFSSMFEEELMTFMESQDMTQAEFVRKCRSASEHDAKVKHYIDVLLSSCEYETFVKLMKVMKPVAELRKLNAAVRTADAKETSSSSGQLSASPAKGEGSPSKQSKGDDSADYFDSGSKAVEMDDLSGAKDSDSNNRSDTKDSK